jgi:hypothetical protein
VFGGAKNKCDKLRQTAQTYRRPILEVHTAQNIETKAAQSKVSSDLF